MHPTSATVLLLFALGAPKLPPGCEFVSHGAEGTDVIIPNPYQAGRMMGVTKLEVDYTLRAPAGKYVVELYVETGGTGEKATLLDSKEVVVEPPPGQDVRDVAGKFYRHEADRNKAQLDAGAKRFLAAQVGSGWSYRLVVRRGDSVVADTGAHWTPYKHVER